MQVNGLVQYFTTTELQLTYARVLKCQTWKNLGRPVEVVLHIISLSVNLFVTQFENRRNFKLVEF